MLFFACFLIIIGVALNRIGYNPSFVENTYFPAIGEILVTVSIICLIMLLYEPDNPARIGLKGAYHRQCIGCHEKVSTESFTPVSCEDCHKKNVPEHKSLLVLSDNPSIKEVTENCLKCHEEKGKEVLNSVHFRWGGHSPQVSGYEHSIELGLHTILNNYMIGTGPNLPYCASCHIGYGWVNTSFNFNDPTLIDCIVCHDTTGKYKKDPYGGGFPDPEINLKEIAESVGLPNRKNCGSCHFYSDGGPNIKHGDLSPNLVLPSPDYDVHMGAFQMVFKDCHYTKNHKIIGRSLTAPALRRRVNLPEMS